LSSKYLNDFRWNFTSENGEDGVLEEIFRRIGKRNEWLCDVGAWDGLIASNTHRLIKQGWQGVLIESSPERCGMIGGERVVPLCVLVEHVGPRTLDLVLAGTSIPQDFDLLCIDTDDWDAMLWASLIHYQPHVVVIEVNSSFAPGEGQHLPRRWNQTITSAVELGKEKGYELALHTGNAIFVRREHAVTLGIDVENWHELFDRGWL